MSHARISRAETKDPAIYAKKPTAVFWQMVVGRSPLVRSIIRTTKGKVSHLGHLRASGARHSTGSHSWPKVVSILAEQVKHGRVHPEAVVNARHLMPAQMVYRSSQVSQPPPHRKGPLSEVTTSNLKLLLDPPSLLPMGVTMCFDQSGRQGVDVMSCSLSLCSQLLKSRSSSCTSAVGFAHVMATACREGATYSA